MRIQIKIAEGKYIHCDGEVKEVIRLLEKIIQNDLDTQPYETWKELYTHLIFGLHKPVLSGYKDENATMLEIHKGKILVNGKGPVASITFTRSELQYLASINLWYDIDRKITQAYEELT